MADQVLTMEKPIMPNNKDHGSLNGLNHTSGVKSEAGEPSEIRYQTLSKRVDRIEEGMRHLEILPQIHAVLCEMKRDLLEPAVGRKQMPISIAIMMIAILGGLLVFREVKDSDKDVMISAAGLKISSGEIVPKKDLGGAER